MPGFTVNGHGSGAAAAVRPYYKYTWELDYLFSSRYLGTTSPLIYAINATLPTWVFDKDEAPGASIKYKQAKNISWNPIKISWYEVVGLASILKKWRELVWTPEEGLKDPSIYKQPSSLRSLTFNWQKPVVWQLHNSWPQEVNSGDLSYSDSDMKVVTVTVEYDWATETTP